nr:MAG TPA: hypothetical protein [Bacteriophage sp.]
MTIIICQYYIYSIGRERKPTVRSGAHGAAPLNPCLFL